MAACILAIVIPLWLNHRKQGKGIALSSLRPSGACLRRYDFWVVLAITVGGAVLLRQSYAIEGIPAISRRPCTPPSSAWGSSSC